jgi:antirestriction protein ArdC
MKATNTSHSNATNQTKKSSIQDIQQQVTDTIIQQLERGTVPWKQPWHSGNTRSFKIPTNITTGNRYRGINVLLLWTSAFTKDLGTDEWASFKQWQTKGEMVKKGERGSQIVYYDTFEKEIEGEIKKIPFLKTSFVFNRSQLESYRPVQIEKPIVDLTTRLQKTDEFVQNTKAVIEHREGQACYVPLLDKIEMPHREYFFNTETCTATEGYYSTLLHELTHWTGHQERLNRIKNKRFADENYATEELLAEMGAAFLCAEMEIGIIDNGDHANYISNWLNVLKQNKQCIFTAASGASSAVDYLHRLQPT